MKDIPQHRCAHIWALRNRVPGGDRGSHETYYCQHDPRHRLTLTGVMGHQYRSIHLVDMVSRGVTVVHDGQERAG